MFCNFHPEMEVLGKLLFYEAVSFTAVQNFQTTTRIKSCSVKQYHLTVRGRIWNDSTALRNKRTRSLELKLSQHTKFRD